MFLKLNLIRKISPIIISFLILFSGLLATFFAWNYNTKLLNFQSLARFDFLTKNAISSLENKENRNLDVLTDVKALVLSQDTDNNIITSKTFKNFVKELDIYSKYPFISSLDFIKNPFNLVSSTYTSFNKKDNSFSIIAPVYTKDKKYLGSIQENIDTGSFLSDIFLSQPEFQNMDFEIYIVSPDKSESLIYDTNPSLHAKEKDTSFLQNRSEISFADMKWSVYSKALPQDILGLTSVRFKNYILIFGFIGSLSLFVINLSLATSRKRAIDIAEIMTASLKRRTEDLEITKENTEAERRKLNTILSSMGECLVAVSSDGRIILMNQMAQATLRIAEADSYGKKIEEVLILVKDGKTLPENEYPVYKAIKGQDISRIYFQDNVFLKDSEGRVFPVVLSAISTLGKNGGAEGVSVIIVFHDISVEKAVDEAKTEFVSLAAHQLRMPLTAIRWYAEMLISEDVGKVNEDQKSYLNEIHQNNERMVNLVNQLLSVSRIRLGTFKIEPKAINLNEIVDSVLGELKPMITKKKMNIVKNYKDDLKPFNADADLMRVVFQNLISNAVKYTPEGGTITISMEYDKDFSIRVSDTGYGIPKKDIGKIFTQLYRAENVKEKDVEGTGLGLYMVKSIVEQAGGMISFSSEENKGTIFHVSFQKTGMRAKSGTKSLS
ncbi:hypothetical protein K8Q94_02645 [Candidatus Nomurabacteria bacterium]|nr:hypothetical protein [Candidatus Nomurabacteria bacterium]